MLTVKKALSSSVGRKYLMAASGIALFGFIIMHLAGNLTLYCPDATAFNSYVQKLYSMGDFLYVAELGLAGLFLFHAVLAIWITAKNRAARDQSYAMSKSKGGPSKSSAASRTMIVSGLAMLGFLVLHIWQFRFGPGIEQGYVTEIGGEATRDLHRLVVETFQNPLYTGIYCVVMVILGFHLRHGFWSAFQSLGATNPRTLKPLQCLAVILAVIIAAGFFFIPLSIYLRGAL